MNAIAGTKKELIDFLWEWAESNGDWSKLLVSKVIDKEQPLDDTERQSIFDYFLQAIKMKSGLPDLASTKPVYLPTTTKIDLISLSDVTGVNKLAENQTINFGDNLTVIYGENGTGKTGYCRILKALGFSYEPQKLIHSNIHSTNDNQTAKISYRADGANEDFVWDGSNSNANLATISVFNNNCVQISLVDGRNLIVSPLGFHLFNLISDELNALTSLLDEAIEKNTSDLSWAINLHTGTPQEVFITNLNAQSAEATLGELATFDSTKVQTLEAKEKELNGLNKDLLNANIKLFTTQINDLKTQGAKITLASEKLSEVNTRALLDNAAKITKLQGTTQTGLKEIAESRGIELYETSQFQDFIKSADTYLKLLDKPNYPEDDDTCIYCQQNLADADAKALLASYRKILNDTTQTDLAELKAANKILLDDIAALDSEIVFTSDAFGIINETEIVQAKEILEYNKALAALKSSIANNTFTDKSGKIDFAHYTSFLDGKKKSIQGKLDAAVETLENLETTEKSLTSIVSELKDRKLLSENLEETKGQIIKLKKIERLEKNRNKFSTNAISRKTTEARDELVKHNFKNIFASELGLLRKSDIKIDLDFGTVKGSSRVQQKMNSTYSLTEILSEGEQKAIALAEYLSEIQLDNSQSPVIFDDPVNSLDHHIIDDVARRLISLSRNRQVIICTHSIILFNSLLYFSKQATFKSLDYKFYNSKNQFGITGYIQLAEEEINSVKECLKPINVMLNNTPKDADEATLAAEGYGHLRSALELLVELNIFKGTVKRYQKNITLGAFVKVDGTLINTHKDELYEIFERASGYVSAHSDPAEIRSSPTLAGLKIDLDKFNSIKSMFPEN